MSSVTFRSGSTFVRSQPSDSIVLAVVQRRWAEGRGSVAAKTVERSEHSVGHVIYEHPGADQNTPERHFTGPVCAVTDLGKTGSEGKETTGRNYVADLTSLPLVWPLSTWHCYTSGI